MRRRHELVSGRRVAGVLPSPSRSSRERRLIIILSCETRRAQTTLISARNNLPVPSHPTPLREARRRNRPRAARLLILIVNPKVFSPRIKSGHLRTAL